ncbi:MAG: hypothetical protein ACD_8C00059G0001 [uncultured bacterium]|nr:MAG: hypothetical protein ACD_8C00059G0001 [uncultured bacterium]
MLNKKTESAENDNKDKNVLKDLEKTISPVLVVNNSALKPYVELFEYLPENIYQQPLGSLVGFFEIKEYSQESAYIVNFLTSVLKKEYYANPKRPVTESLDSALHKVNLALSELAKQGIVQWLGKINAAICVLEKNNAHFSVSGNAKIFLYRKQILSEISEGLASDLPEPHPLKTFINVSSGRLEKNDRLLITSEDIFHILPILEIKKNFQRHEGEKFVQFLRTALSNQMEMIASMVVEMNETVPEPTTKKASRKKILSTTNVFSEKTFANSSAPEIDIQKDLFEESEEILEESGYTDKKTGHIYIQGEASSSIPEANPQLSLYKDLAKEKITQAVFVTKNEIRKRWSLYKKQLAKKRELRIQEQARLAEIEAEEKKRLEEQRVLEEIENEQRLAEQRELEEIRLQQEKIALAEQAKIAKKEELERIEIQQKIQVQINDEPEKEEFQEIEIEAEIENSPLSKYEMSFKEKLRRAKMEQQQKQHGESIDLRKTEISSVITEELEYQEEIIEIHRGNGKIEAEKQSLKSNLQDFGKKFIPTIKRVAQFAIKSSGEIWQKIKTKKTARTENSSTLSVVPHLSTIKNLYARFNSKQKLYIFGALALIFIVPIFIVRFMDKPKEELVAQLPAAPPTQQEILRNEKNITFDTQIKNVISKKDVVATLLANDNPTLISKTTITIIENNQPSEFPIPAEFGTPIKSAYMQDLSLIFLVTDSSKVISFSPISKKFTDNKIDFANISKGSFIGTYLTYMYVLDQKSNQIYRFPRADGGFGEQSNWLKDSISLSGVSGMTIDDNIYVIQNNQVLKFFKGQKQSFTLEASATPVQFGNLFTTPDLQFIYALDTQNSRLVQYSKDGNISAQYFSKDLEDGISLGVDEKNKIAFVATSEGLISISIQ